MDNDRTADNRLWARQLQGRRLNGSEQSTSNWLNTAQITGVRDTAVWRTVVHASRVPVGSSALAHDGRVLFQVGDGESVNVQASQLVDSGVVGKEGDVQSDLYWLLRSELSELDIAKDHHLRLTVWLEETAGDLSDRSDRKLGLLGVGSEGTGQDQ